MSSAKTKLRWSLSAVIMLAMLGGSYAMGRSRFDPVAMLRRLEAPTDSTAFAVSLYNRCNTAVGEAKTMCYSVTLDSMARRGEVRLAMRTLARLGPMDMDVVREGHVIAHGIGMAAGRGGSDIARMFAQCDESNQSGCYHGVLQSYLIAAKSVGRAEINAVCQSFRGPKADRWLLFQCVHGAGHGLTMYYEHDAPRALKDCEYFGDEWDRQSCYGGVFMENIVNVQMPKSMVHQHGGTQTPASAKMPPSEWKPLDPSDLLYPCSIMETKYLSACYEMQTAAILYQNGGDIGGAARTCETAPMAMRYVCYQSLGRDISSYALQDHGRAKAMCALGTPKYQPWCYGGLVKSFINMNARAEDGVAFCRELEGEPVKLKCYEAVGEQIGTLRNGSVERSALCRSAETDYRDACLFGARVTPVAPPALARLNAASARSL